MSPQPELLHVVAQVGLTRILPRGFSWDRKAWVLGRVRLFGLPGVTLFGPVMMLKRFAHQTSCGYGDACEVLLDLIQYAASFSTKSCRRGRAATPSGAPGYRDR
jgi:hypothetical protein